MPGRNVLLDSQHDHGKEVRVAGAPGTQKHLRRFPIEPQRTIDFREIERRSILLRVHLHGAKECLARGLCVALLLPEESQIVPCAKRPRAVFWPGYRWRLRLG